MDAIRDSFYVTFFSNSSMKLCHKNKTAVFTVQIAHEIDLGTDGWELGLCKFSGPPTEVGILKPAVVVGDTHALIYCTLINRQFMGGQKARV